MHPTKSHLFDSFLHSSKATASPQSANDPLIDQILDLERKKLLLQKNNGSVTGDELKRKIQQLVEDLEELQHPKPKATATPSKLIPPPATPTAPFTPPFMRSVNSVRSPPENPLTSSKQAAIQALLADLDHETFSDDGDDIDEDDSVYSASDRRISRGNSSVRGNSARLSLSRTTELSEVFTPQALHHPLSNRLNYQNISAPTVAGTRPNSTTFTPPRYTLNNRTISIASETGGRESFGSVGGVMERVASVAHQTSIDETIPRQHHPELVDFSSDLVHAIASKRASIGGGDDLETEFLEKSAANLSHDLTTSQSPPMNQEPVAATPPSNLLEFCMIEADWNELVKQSTAHLHQETVAPDPSQPHLLTKGKFLSNLVPSKLVWRYPANVDEQTNNTSTIQEQNFFFPSGVKVELVSKAVMDIKTRPYQQKRHIVPFNDRQGLPLFACCLTVHQVYEIEEVKQIHEEIPMYLYRILRGKQAAITIQKAFRLYQKQKRIKQWQSIDIADIKRLQQERQFYSSQHHGNGSTASDTTGTASQAGNSRFSFHGGNNNSSGTPHHRGSATNAQNTQASGGGFFSRLFNRRGSGGGGGDLPDQSSHQGEQSHHGGFFGMSRHDRSYTVSSHGKPEGSTTSTPTKHNSITTTSNSTSTSTPTAGAAPQRSSSLNFFGRASLGTATKARGASLDKTKSESSIDYVSSPAATGHAPRSSSKEEDKVHDEIKQPEVVETPEKAQAHHESSNNSNQHTPASNKATGGIPSIVPIAIPPTVIVEETEEDQTPLDTSHHEEVFNFESFIEDKVVIGQKAYCIISSSPEYTFIFLILDAIHEAETEFYKERMIRLKKQQSADENDHSHSLPPLSIEEHELLRSKFLSKVKLFMEYYLLNKQFQLEDLSNRFIVPRDYFQYKLNTFPAFQSNKHRQRYEFYHQLMFPHRTLPANQQEFEEELNNKNTNDDLNNASFFFDSPRMSPKPPSSATSNTSHSVRRTLSRSFSYQDHNDISSSVSHSNRNSRRIGDRIKELSLSDPITNNSSSVTSVEDSYDPTTTQESAFSPEQSQPQSKLSRKKKDLTVVTSPITLVPNHHPTTGTPTASTYSQQLRVRGYGKALKIDFRYLLSTKEWSCAVLFTHLNSQVIFKIMNLLLMEKSLIIYGKNPGIVSAITLGVINLISPFLWEGIFIPLVPDIARELFGAPVPLVIGTISPPRMADVSAGTAILHLNDDTVQAKLLFTLTPNPHSAANANNPPSNSNNNSNESKEGGDLTRSTSQQQSSASSIYGVKMPALPKKKRKQSFYNNNHPSNTATTTPSASASANHHNNLHNSSQLALSAAIASAGSDIFEDHTITVHVQEIDFLAWFTRLPEVTADMPLQEEISHRITHLRKLVCHYLLPKLHYVYDIFLYDPRQILEELETKGQLNEVINQIHHNRDATTVQPQPIYLKTMEKSIKVENTIDHLLLSQRLPVTILQQQMILLTRLKQYNYHFCGEILSHTYDWNRFLKRNEKTQMEEFYPNLFLEIIRNKLEFQDAMVHTQMFISFLDRMRKEMLLLNQIRRYIGEWVYHHYHRRKQLKTQRLLSQSQSPKQQQPSLVVVVKKE